MPPTTITLSTMDNIRPTIFFNSEQRDRITQHNNTFLSFDDEPDIWQEPEIAHQVPCATGYPLDVPPPQKLLPKIKKLSARRKHNIITNNHRNDGSSTSTVESHSDSNHENNIIGGHSSSDDHHHDISFLEAFALRPEIVAQAQPFSIEEDDESHRPHEDAQNDGDNDNTLNDSNSQSSKIKGSSKSPLSKKSQQSFDIPFSQHIPNDYHLTSPSRTVSSVGSTPSVVSSPTPSVSSISSLNAPDSSENTKRNKLIVTLKTSITEDITSPSFLRRGAGKQPPSRSKAKPKQVPVKPSFERNQKLIQSFFSSTPSTSTTTTPLSVGSSSSPKKSASLKLNNSTELEKISIQEQTTPASSSASSSSSSSTSASSALASTSTSTSTSAPSSAVVNENINTTEILTSNELIKPSLEEISSSSSTKRQIDDSPTPVKTKRPYKKRKSAKYVSFYYFHNLNFFLFL